MSETSLMFFRAISIGVAAGFFLLGIYHGIRMLLHIRPDKRLLVGVLPFYLLISDNALDDAGKIYRAKFLKYVLVFIVIMVCAIAVELILGN